MSRAVLPSLSRWASRGVDTWDSASMIPACENRTAVAAQPPALGQQQAGAHTSERSRTGPRCLRTRCSCCRGVKLPGWIAHSSGRGSAPASARTLLCCIPRSVALQADSSAGGRASSISRKVADQLASSPLAHLSQNAFAQLSPVLFGCLVQGESTPLC